MNSILVMGASGFLGDFLSRYFASQNYLVHKMGRKELDLEKPLPLSFAKFLSEQKITHALICSAVARIDECKAHPEKTRQVNVVGLQEVLKVLKAAQVFPMFFSTDQVYAALEKAPVEADIPHPPTEYGRQKLETENFIRKQFEQYLILRCTKMFSLEKHPRNPIFDLYQKLLRGDSMLAARNQWISPIFIEDIAAMSKSLIENKKTGVYHLSANEKTSRLELVEKIAECSRVSTKSCKACDVAEIKTLEPMPTWSHLNSQKIQQATGIPFRTLTQGLKQITFWE